MDKREKLEHLEGQLFHLGEALENIAEVEHCEDIVDAITDRIFVLTFAKEELEKRIDRENARELAALTREYWRSVL
jgi:hypothetical protein